MSNPSSNLSPEAQPRTWVAPNFTPHATPAAEPRQQPASARPKAEDTAAALRQMAELADAKERARQEGFAQGLQEGRTAAAQAYSEEIGAAREQMSTLALSLQQQVAQSENALAAELLDLALSLARSMTRAAFEIKPELVAPIIHACIQSIPGASDIELHLHPDDLALVQGRGKQTGDPVTYRPDTTLERGECYLSGPANAVDARHRTRWAELMATLSLNHQWIEHD